MSKKENALPIASFRYQREIRMVDTDATGFAHFGSYIRMMEETEYAFLRSRGLSVVLHDERGTMGFPRLSAQVDVLEPLQFGDEVTVELNLTHVDGKQVEYHFRLLRLDVVVVEGYFKAAFCRFPANKPPYAILIPDSVVEALTSTHASCSAS